MPKTADDLFAHLSGLGIETTTVRHPPLFTVAESQALRGQITGAHTKNLFVKDKKDNYFLLTVDEQAVVDLKRIHERIGGASKVSFGKPEAMLELLGVTPGAVTIFGLINDSGLRVKPVIDAALLKAEIVNGHPLTNDATTSITPDDLLRFVTSTGHEALILDFEAGSAHVST